MSAARSARGAPAGRRGPARRPAPPLARLATLGLLGVLGASPAAAQRAVAGAPPDHNMALDAATTVTAVAPDGADSRTDAGAPPRPHRRAPAGPTHHRFDADATTPTPDRSPASALAVRQYYGRMALGFAASILFHESAHVAASYLVGARPTFGSDAGRPTVYSGIDAAREPHKQLVFSSAGLVAQAALDETILDVPHRTAGAFERGVLLGGLSTAFFYVTLGRNASVSDVTYIARTSGWSKTQVSLLVGGVAALHTVRVSRGDRYARFFLAPGPDGRLRLACRISPDA